MALPESSPGQSLYYAAINGRERGPYQLAFIEALVLSGQCGADVQVRKEAATHWVKLNSMTEPPPIPLPPKPSPVAPPSIPNIPTRKPTPPFLAQLKELGWGVLKVGCVILAFMGSAAIKSCNSSSRVQTPTYSSYTAPVATPYTPPQTYTPPAADYTPPQTSPTPDQGAVTPSPTIPSQAATTYSVLDSSGRSYRVSLSDYRILGDKEAALTLTLGVINSLKAERAIETRQIETARTYLDNTDQTAVDSFNAKVDSYNQRGDTLQQKIDSYNAGVKDHNDYLLQVGTPSS
jgi:hypothetical protein